MTVSVTPAQFEFVDFDANGRSVAQAARVKLDRSDTLTPDNKKSPEAFAGFRGSNPLLSATLVEPFLTRENHEHK